MIDWKKYKFCDVIEINPTVSLKNNEKYSFVEMKDLTNGKRYCEPSDKRKLAGGSRFQNEDTLFARITPCLENGKICQVRKLKNAVGFGSTEFLIFRGKHEFTDNNFVFYLSRSDLIRSYAEQSFDGTSGRQRVSKSTIENLQIEIPPLSEQHAIASVLSSLDDKIDLLHRQNKTLEAMAETLFRQWFVEEAEDFEEGILGDVLELIYGKGLKEAIRTGAGFPVVGSSGIVGFHSEYLVECPGIVIGRKGTLGKVLYIFENFFPIDTTYYIKSKLTSFELIYEYFLLKTLNFEDMNSDSAVPGLNRDIALSTEIKIPPLNKMNDFNQCCSTFFNKLNKNSKQIRTLEKLRDTLLPKLMSGEVRVNV